MIRTYACTASLVLALVTSMFTAGVLDLAAAEQYQHGLPCTGCHQMPPLDSQYRNVSSGGFKGNHATHNPPSIAGKEACEKCHAESAGFTSGHRNGLINMTSNINNSVHPSRGTYEKPRFFNQTSKPMMQTCANVNCHFETTTPLWGRTAYSGEADCSACHPSPGNSVSHTKHESYFPFSSNGCKQCHPDYKTGLKFSHATSAGHGGRGIRITLTEGSYSGSGLDFLPSRSGLRSFGSCSGTYCHSPGTKATSPFAAPAQSATWGGALGCGGCHAATPGTGSHSAHVSSPYGVPVPCYKCHSATVTKEMTVSSSRKHVNRMIDIAFNNSTTAVFGKYSGQTVPMQKNPGSGFETCENVYCHSNGQNPGGTWPPTYSSPKWGDQGTGRCGTCHDHGYHSGFARISTGSHGKHMKYGFGEGSNACGICHYGTGFANPSCRQCHFAGSPANGLHINHKVEVTFVGRYGGTYNGTEEPGDGYGTCSNVYCHSDGTSLATGLAPANTSAAWGSRNLACAACHGNPPSYPNGSPKANSHGVHSAFACNRCHVNTTSDGTTITGLSSHVNKSYNVNAGEGVSFSYTFDPTGGTCSNISCHSGGSAKWGETGP